MKKLINKLILILLFLTILSIGCYIDLHYQFARFLRAREQTEQREMILKNTHEKILQTDRYRELLTKTNAEFDQAKTGLPNVANIQAFINATLQSGKDEGLIFLTVNPQPTIQKDFYHIISVELTLQGTYQQFSNFLNLLNKQHDFIKLNNFSMTRQAPAETTVLKNNNTPDSLIINATVDFYYA